MPTVKLRDPQGGEKGQVELPAALFEAKINRHVMWLAVQSYLTNRRQGTSAVKSRAAVSGGGIKPWRQKGTGRARAGTIRSPIWVGGGRAFGPCPKDYHSDLPKKVKRLAFRSALTVQAKDGQVTILTDPGVSEGKTREIASLLKQLGLAGRNCLLITEANDPKVLRAARNLPHLVTTSASQAHAYEILRAEHVLITQAALQELKEARAS